MALLDFAFRWAHILFALVWIGHNYANVVKHPTFMPLNGEASETERSAALEARLQREHGTFRYASIVVWASGMGMLWQRGWLRERSAAWRRTRLCWCLPSGVALRA